MRAQPALGSGSDAPALAGVAGLSLHRVWSSWVEHTLKIEYLPFDFDLYLSSDSNTVDSSTNNRARTRRPFPLSTQSAPNGHERHLSPQDLADRVGVPLQTIYGWRVYHKGPRAMRIGKHLRYRLADVLAWEESQLDESKASA
ncbi:helix-turn-helix domain-containing protein [Arthrobacter sp. IA7]|uniref:helix-turn-helix transcriptional regulator n=1 Tax=Arthrobacter ipis TaxID=2716202 RepID=UPI0016887BC1|nr:helix-turn-helix domain-containing protein [Arthrobacter ipis]